MHILQAATSTYSSVPLARKMPDSVTSLAADVRRGAYEGHSHQTPKYEKNEYGEFLFLNMTKSSEHLLHRLAPRPNRLLPNFFCLALCPLLSVLFNTGLGILWLTRNSKLICAGFAPGSPARAAGVKSGDILKAVDGTDILQVSLCVHPFRLGENVAFISSCFLISVDFQTCVVELCAVPHTDEGGRENG
jgi:predicted metalloprotease with PDZ domain